VVDPLTDPPGLDGAAIRRQGPSIRPRVRSRVDLLIATAVVLLVAAPLLFTSSGFGLDFTNHLWLSWVEGTGLAQAGHPSYFLNARGIGVFYPFFAFYGGTLYTLVGGISDLLGGQPIAAYVGVTTLAVAGTYGGMIWLSRETGLRGTKIHAPALAVVTSAYYITNLYGRGAWTEFIAVAVIAPLIASGVHLARAEMWRAAPLLVFVVCAIVFSGSHNITLVWGSTFMIFGGVIMWLTLGAPRGMPLGRLAMLAGIALASIAVNAWFLLPDASYAKDVTAHLEIARGGASVTFFDTFALLFDPLRKVPAQSTTPALFVQIPVWFLLWSLTAAALLMRRHDFDTRLRRVWLGALALLAVLLCMVMITPIWSVMPFPFDQIQFPYRLGSYIFYTISGLVLVSALAMQRAAAGTTVVWLRRSLVAVCAVSVGLCVWQQWVPTTLFAEYSYANRSQALASVNVEPRTWYDRISYTDVQAPVVPVPAGRALVIPPESVRGDRFAAWLDVPPGPAPIQTNIAGGSYLVRIGGLERVGRDARGLTVVRRDGTGSGPVHVVLETTRSATIELGWALSLIGLAIVLAALGWTGIARSRERRRGPQASREYPRARRARSG
jgi:hypothetical protein